MARTRIWVEEKDKNYNSNATFVGYRSVITVGQSVRLSRRILHRQEKDKNAETAHILYVSSPFPGIPRGKVALIHV